MAELARRGDAPGGRRTPELAEQIAARRWRDEPYAGQRAAGVLDPRTLSIALDRLLPGERTVVVDSGAFMGWPAMYLARPRRGRLRLPQGFQCVGLALGNAIGAAIARPDRLTVAALGDGGALMSLRELETLGRLGLRMLIVIYDDAAYGAEVHHFGPMGEAGRPRAVPRHRLRRARARGRRATGSPCARSTTSAPLRDGSPPPTGRFCSTPRSTRRSAANGSPRRSRH